MKWKVLRTIRDRDTNEVIQPGGIWDDRDQRNEYERDILIAMGAIEALPESTTHSDWVGRDKEQQHELY